MRAYVCSFGQRSNPLLTSPLSPSFHPPKIDEFKQKIHDRSRDWEQKEQVLGHLVRSQADRPKAQLSVPTMRELRAEAAALGLGAWSFSNGLGEK